MFYISQLHWVFNFTSTGFIFFCWGIFLLCCPTTLKDRSFIDHSGQDGKKKFLEVNLIVFGVGLLFLMVVRSKLLVFPVL